ISSIKPKASSVAISAPWKSKLHDPLSAYFVLKLPFMRKTLYCRRTYHNHFGFLGDDVMQKGNLGWIRGPPRTGKSITTLAFASTRMDRDVDTFEQDDAMAVRAHDWKRSGYANNISTSRMYVMCCILMITRSLISFGLMMGAVLASLSGECVRWALEEKRARVVVDHTKARVHLHFRRPREVSENLALVTGANEFRALSWKHEDYLSDDELFNSVSPYLDAQRKSSSEQLTRSMMVPHKLYFSGGRRRSMFYFPVSTVMAKLTEAYDIAFFAAFRGLSSSTSSRRLNPAAVLFARTCSHEVIKKMISFAYVRNLNPALSELSIRHEFSTWQALMIASRWQSTLIKLPIEMLPDTSYY
ncbi:TPA: hypothetical protein N0F65_000850, partial [Lagenidium giganteum]